MPTSTSPLERFPRVGLATLPTPLHEAPRLSAELGCDIRIKRDDLTGLALGGNKVRKLEFLLGAAEAEGADTVVTFGALQSNATTAELWQGSSSGLTSDKPTHYAWVILALDGDDACAFTIADGQAGQPTELDFGGEDGLQWGVTIKCFEDATGMFWHGPYFDAAVS
jgi:hypothetical protein